MASIFFMEPFLFTLIMIFLLTFGAIFAIRSLSLIQVLLEPVVYIIVYATFIHLMIAFFPSTFLAFGPLETVELVFNIIYWVIIGLIYVFQAFGSITGGPISVILWVMYADTADYSEWKTSRRATGLVFSASIMSNKLGWAFGSMIAAFILSMTGFIPDIIQPVYVQNGLKAMMSVIPVAAGIIALIIITFFYKLDESTMQKIKTELEERRGESEDSK